MKTYTSLLPLLFLTSTLLAQSFSDDFESYSAAQGVAAASNVWATPTSANGGADDLVVSTANAHSGSQSLHFTSNVSGGGGPANLLLPLPQTITSGVLTLEWWMSIEAISNLAAARVDLWEFNNASSVATQLRFSSFYTWDPGLKLQILNGVEVNFACHVPSNEWFKMTVQCTIHEDQWEVFINDVSQGVFHNTPNQLSVVSFKPFNGDSYFIDDVHYTYEPYTAPDLGLAISAIESADWANRIGQPYHWDRNRFSEIAGKQMNPRVQLRNVGSQPITSFDATIQYNGQNYSESVNTINLAPQQDYRFELPTAFVVDDEVDEMTVTITSVNGSAIEPVTRSLQIIPIIPNEHKKVLMEASTGTWCQWCPRSRVAIEDITERFPEYAAHIAVHQDDPMASDAFDAAVFWYIPTARIMDYYVCGPEFYLPRFYEEIQQEPITAIELETHYDSAAHLLEVIAHTTFLSDTTGDFSIKITLTEDSVTGTGNEWGQMNAFYGGIMGEMNGYELLPYLVPAEQMVYNQVARMAAPNYFPGLENPFTGAMLEDVTTSHTFTFELAEGMDPARLHVTAEVRESYLGVDNIASTMLTEVVEDTTSEVSVESLKRSFDAMRLYPNPASDRVQCELSLERATGVEIAVLNRQGQCLRRMECGILAGQQSLEIPLDQLESGLYFVQVITDHAMHVRRLVRE